MGKTLEQIQRDFKAYIQQNYQDPALSQVLDLWDRYIQYRQGLGELTPPAGLDQEDPAYYRSIYASTQNLRKRFSLIMKLKDCLALKIPIMNIP